ncbi:MULTISPECIES: hypothetical protein [Kitasatospora]|nr:MULTISPECIES: hypothetical protein [Kitasatospora]
MTPHTRSAALLAAAVPGLLACLLAATPAAAAAAVADTRPVAPGAPHGAHRPVDKVHPVQPPPGRLAQGEPVQRAVPGPAAR